MSGRTPLWLAVALAGCATVNACFITADCTDVAQCACATDSDCAFLSASSYMAARANLRVPLGHRRFRRSHRAARP